MSVESVEVKVETDWQEDLSGESEASVSSSLYQSHVVKGEMVQAPDLVEIQGIIFLC